MQVPMGCSASVARPGWVPPQNFGTSEDLANVPKPSEAPPSPTPGPGTDVETPSEITGASIRDLYDFCEVLGELVTREAPPGRRFCIHASEISLGTLCGHTIWTRLLDRLSSIVRSLRLTRPTCAASLGRGGYSIVRSAINRKTGQKVRLLLFGGLTQPTF